MNFYKNFREVITKKILKTQIFGKQPPCLSLDCSHVRAFVHSELLKILRRWKNWEVLGCNGSTMYPVPYPLCDWLARHFVNLSGYSFYIIKKMSGSP